MIKQTAKDLKNNLDGIADQISEIFVKSPNRFTTNDINGTIDRFGLAYTMASFLFWSCPAMELNFDRNYSTFDDLEDRIQYLTKELKRTLIAMKVTEPGSNPPKELNVGTLCTHILARRVDPRADKTAKLRGKSFQPLKWEDPIDLGLIEVMIHQYEEAIADGIKNGVPANKRKKLKAGDINVALKELVIDAMRKIPDPDVPGNIIQMDLVDPSSIKIRPNGRNEIQVTFQPTTPGCFMKEKFPRVIRAAVKWALLQHGYNMQVNVLTMDNKNIFSMARQNDTKDWEAVQRTFPNWQDRKEFLKKAMFARGKLGGVAEMAAKIAQAAKSHLVTIK